MSIFLFTGLTFSSLSACPDLSTLRSPEVVSNFSATELENFWYEQAYIDIAQVGSTCQTLNGSVADGKLSMDFRVKYGPVPFTIKELYTPASFRGGFSKNAAMPGGKLLTLPTVAVHVSASAFILFSCLEVPLLPPVIEFVLATRARTIDDDSLAALLSLAHSLNVPFDDAALLRSDHNASTCGSW